MALEPTPVEAASPARSGEAGDADLLDDPGLAGDRSGTPSPVQIFVFLFFLGLLALLGATAVDASGLLLVPGGCGGP